MPVSKDASACSNASMASIGHVYHGDEGFARWVGWGVIANNLTKIGTHVACRPANLYSVRPTH